MADKPIQLGQVVTTRMDEFVSIEWLLVLRQILWIADLQSVLSRFRLSVTSVRFQF